MQLEDGKQKKFSGNGMNLPSLGSFLLFVMANTVRRELLDVHRDKKIQPVVEEDDFEMMAKFLVTEEEPEEAETPVHSSDHGEKEEPEGGEEEEPAHSSDHSPGEDPDKGAEEQAHGSDHGEEEPDEEPERGGDGLDGAEVPDGAEVLDGA